MNELSATRFIDAPPEKVWDIMANRQEAWWCPAPWRIEMVAQERRAGGRSAMIMRGPDGEEMPQEGIFLEWTEGKRFVTTDAVTADHQPADPFMIGIWEIEPEAGGTRYTASARHWTEDARKQHEEMGFEQGWGACADQLKALAEAS
jgi:uncharacterized protein YndB with AHSA1/START domain